MCNNRGPLAFESVVLTANFPCGSLSPLWLGFPSNLFSTLSHPSFWQPQFSIHKKLHGEHTTCVILPCCMPAFWTLIDFANFRLELEHHFHFRLCRIFTLAQVRIATSGSRIFFWGLKMSIFMLSPEGLVLIFVQLHMTCPTGKRKQRGFRVYQVNPKDWGFESLNHVMNCCLKFWAWIIFAISYEELKN